MNRKNELLAILLSSIVFCWPLGYALAEPVVQTFKLEAGWNAVFLEVQPDDTDPAVVFSSLISNSNLVSVWAWNPQAGTVEFIQDPNELSQKDPQMLVYIPNEAEPKLITNLHAIHGNKAYLIEMNNATTLTVQGEPLVPDIDWKPNSFNFVGVHLDPGSPPPLFTNFFSGSLAHEDQEIFELDNVTNSWVEVNTSDPMLRGEGFWIYCKGSSEFNGPVSMQLERGDGLEFGSVLTVQDVVFRNDSSSPKTITLDSTSATDWLKYWHFDPANDIAEWTSFPPANMNLAAGETKRLRLGVKRAGLTASNTNTANVSVSVSEGPNSYTYFQVPVSVTGIDYTGLWVGSARINKVSDVNEEPVSITPVPTGTEFSYRLIVHVDDTGEASLLNQVIQMWDDVTGTTVLFTDDSLIPNYAGIGLRDGQAVARRISAPAFGHFYDVDTVSPLTGAAGLTRVGEKALVARNGGFGRDGGLLMAQLVLPRDDPSNPFVHSYHPDHRAPQVINDPDQPGSQKWDQPSERLFEVTRALTLIFQDTDSDGNALSGSAGLGWGSSDMGGVYQETISGLHKNPIHIEGTFSLHKVSGVGILTQP